MRTLSGPRRRAAVTAAAVLITAVAVVTVARWPRSPSQSAQSATPSATAPRPTPSASATPEPLPTPLPGATDGDQMAACDPGRLPRRGAPQEAEPPVGGPVSLEVVGQLGGTAGAATLDGGRMFVGSGLRVVEVDLSDALRPREMTVSDALPGEVGAIERAGTLLVVGVGDAGLAVVDPAAGLAMRGLVPLPGHVEAVAVVGSTAFVADGPGGLRIVDLADPERPRELAIFLDLHRITDVVVVGDRAYLAAADEGLIVVDVSRPAGPVEVGRLFTGGYAFRLAAAGGRVLLADGWGGVRIVDVTDAPRLVATIPTTGWAMDVAVDGDRGYVAAGNQLAVVGDVTVGQPAASGNLPLPAGHAARIDVADGRAVVVDDTAGVRIVDVTGDTPIELSAYAPLSPANGLAVLDDRAYVAGLGTGLRVIDISDPRRPTEQATIRTADFVTAAVAVGSRTVFSTWPRPDSQWVGSIFTMTADGSGEPSSPVAGPLFIGTTVDGDLLFIAAEGQIAVLDASGDRPCLLGELRTTEYASGEGFEANGVTIAGDHLYVAPYYDRVRVVDISNPRSPVLLEAGGGSDGVGVGKLLAAGPTLYAIGADDEGPVVALFDLEDPTAPRLTGRVRLPAETARADESGPHLAYSAGRLFVADGAAGLIVIDVSDPAKPAIAGRLRLSGEAVGVAVQDEHAYVATNGGGLFVVQWTSLAQASVSGPDAIVAAAYASTSGAAAPAPAQVSPPCDVTAATDSGPGSLRDCLAQAGFGSVVTFDPAAFPTDDPTTIALESPLEMPDGVTIDGHDAGVILHGQGDVDEGLRVGSETTIHGLTVTGFVSAGIDVDGGGNTIAGNVISDNGEVGLILQGEDNRVVGNLIGLDPTGTGLWGRQSVGVNADSNSVIGGPTEAERNVISGGYILVNVKSVHGTTIEGNYLGTDVTGRVALTHGESRPVDLNVGSWGNRITGNVVSGQIVIIDPGSSFNAVVGNLIGLDPSGTRPLDGGGGVIIDEPYNQIGGSQPGEGNRINGGVQASNVIVLGNRLGVGVDGAPLGNGSIGVVKPRAVVGGRSPEAGNVVVGGSIDLRSEGALVIGNRVGRAEFEEDTGLRIVSGARNHLVANVVDTRVARGIDLVAGAFGNVLRGNAIRRNAIGLLADRTTESNVIVSNVFDGNDVQARDAGRDNAWDDGRRGNFWSDFGSADADGDGVRDRPREIAPAGIDRYPLTAPP